MRVKHTHQWNFTNRSFLRDHRTLHFATGYYMVQLVCDCGGEAVRVHHLNTKRFLHYRGVQFGNPELSKVVARVKSDPLKEA